MQWAVCWDRICIIIVEPSPCTSNVSSGYEDPWSSSTRWVGWLVMTYHWVLHEFGWGIRVARLTDPVAVWSLWTSWAGCWTSQSLHPWVRRRRRVTGSSQTSRLGLHWGFCLCLQWLYWIPRYGRSGTSVYVGLAGPCRWVRYLCYLVSEASVLGTYPPTWVIPGRSLSIYPVTGTSQGLRS